MKFYILISILSLLGLVLIFFFLRKLILKTLDKIEKCVPPELCAPLKRILKRWILIFLILIVLIVLHFIIAFSKLKTEISNFLHKLLVSLYILFGTIAFMDFASIFLKIYTRKIKEALPSVSILENIVKISILIVGLLILLHFWGISILPIVTALGIGGIAVALALQDTLSNLFAGFHIIISKHIRQGDYVRLASGEEGYVLDINWRNTVIKSLQNNLIIVPNSKISSTIVTNFHLPEKDLFLTIPVSVSFDSDLNRVEKLTVEVAKEVLREFYKKDENFEIFIRYNSFGEYGINFNIFVKIKEFSHQFLIRHEIIKRLNERYKEEKIIIPYPIRKIYIEEREKIS
ncbi:MAG: mechanosensitive ion channel domain-containing protein [Candidatus Hydrothermales bacterium]